MSTDVTLGATTFSTKPKYIEALSLYIDGILKDTGAEMKDLAKAVGISLSTLSQIHIKRYEIVRPFTHYKFRHIMPEDIFKFFDAIYHTEYEEWLKKRNLQMKVKGSAKRQNTFLKKFLSFFTK